MELLLALARRSLVARKQDRMLWRVIPIWERLYVLFRMHLIERYHIVELFQQLVRLFGLLSNFVHQLLAFLLVFGLLRGDLLTDVIVARILDGQCLVRLLQVIHCGLVDHPGFDCVEIDFWRSLRVSDDPDCVRDLERV